MSLEHIAEEKISAELQLYQFFVAKPKFDIKGTDLIAFVEFKDSFKLGRIQSKGRSLLTQKTCSVKIKIEYVEESFFVFVYFNTNPISNNLYFFSVDDIINEWKKSGENYSFCFKKSDLELKRYDKYIFDLKKCELMRKQILMNKTEPEKLLLNIVGSYKQQFIKSDEKNKLELMISEYRRAESEIQNSNEQLELLKEIMNLRFKYEMEEVPKELKCKIMEDKDISLELLIDKYTPVLVKYIDQKMVIDYLMYFKEA